MSSLINHNRLLTEIGPILSVGIEELHATESVKRYPTALVKKAAKLTESTKFLMPILVDAKGTIIAGELWHPFCEPLLVDG